MNTGIVIVHYNDYESLKSLIDNIKDYKVLDKIVIVDNNSSKNIKTKLKRIKHEKIKVLFLDENKGYSYAINEGSKYLIGEFGKCNIIVSNSDVIIDKEKDIKSLIKTLLKKDVAVCAPVILEGRSLNRGWKLPKPYQEIITNIPIIGKKYFNKHLLYKESEYIDDETEVDVVSGCFFLIRSTILKDIEFLDENIFLYYEENILSKKIEKLNKKILLNNNVIVIHNHSVTIDKNVKKIDKYKLQKNSQYYFEKEYNNASNLDLILLKVVSKITEILLRIKYR